MTNQEQAIAILNELIAMDRRSPFAGELGKAVDLLNKGDDSALTKATARVKKV